MSLGLTVIAPVMSTGPKLQENMVLELTSVHEQIQGPISIPSECHAADATRVQSWTVKKTPLQIALQWMMQRGLVPLLFPSKEQEVIDGTMLAELVHPFKDYPPDVSPSHACTLQIWEENGHRLDALAEEMQISNVNRGTGNGK